MPDEHRWFDEQQGRGWVCSASHPTIAAEVRRWCDRVKRIKGFMVMSGVFLAGHAKAAA
ncbi:hypothetical protein NKI20_07385 [Mesorhizobium sp. M0830]